MIRSEHCRAARALLGWTQQELADQADLGLITVRNFEAGKTTPHKGTLRLLRETFERHGITFITEGGVGVMLTDTHASQP
ncbi:Helix-turn-helix [Limimonas halophila]|uniref:Helix-turn-helix n=1 Tax=Limimonas halophila TaxID=1082479 RepID=A0A1G7S4B0_9PROT|nr:helix-turn-helix domain-containing protein [Limimonas halophila]SDG17887.1 Helix-turn-helix [Limimonas halophila]